jgi:Spy/CpxP family protein refolding chaperone
MNKAALSAICLFVVSTFSYATSADKTNVYSGQESREIKSLAAEDVENYLAGKGMGLAKAAELNGYPGPSHVLALAGELGLSPEQKQRTEMLFKAMEAKAKEIGRTLIDEERKLDQLFASKSITSETLALSLKRIGELQAHVRQAHLESHLTQVAILTPEQMASYVKLRGYGDVKKNLQRSDHKH